MRYTLVWHESAQNELARLWLAAENPTAVAAAADSIDIQLAADPHQKGEVGGGVLRRLAVVPLEVLFAVDDGDRKVRVVAVRLC